MFQTLEYLNNWFIHNTNKEKEIAYICGHLMTAIYNNKTDTRKLLKHFYTEQHKAAISFIHKNNNHWILIYINAINKKVYIIDSIKNCNEVSEVSFFDICSAV